MKSHTVIASQSGERIVTSTTEQLKIKASQIEPGDWLLRATGQRFPMKYRRVKSVQREGSLIVCDCHLGAFITFGASDTVDVERTK